MLTSCTAQINTLLHLFSPNHSDISPHLNPLSLLSLCLLSLLSGAQTTLCFVLSFLCLSPSLLDRHRGCGFAGISVVEGVSLWRLASVVDIGVCVWGWGVGHGGYWVLESMNWWLGYGNWWLGCGNWWLGCWIWWLGYGVGDWVVESVIGLSVLVTGLWETVIGLCGFGFWWVIRWRSSVCLGLWVWIWWWWCCWILGGGGGCCAVGEFSLSLSLSSRFIVLGLLCF